LFKRDRALIFPFSLFFFSFFFLSFFFLFSFFPASTSGYKKPALLAMLVGCAIRFATINQKNRTKRYLANFPSLFFAPIVFRVDVGFVVTDFSSKTFVP